MTVQSSFHRACKYVQQLSYNQGQALAWANFTPNGQSINIIWKHGKSLTRGIENTKNMSENAGDAFFEFTSLADARESVHVSNWSLQFQIVSNTVRMHHLLSLISIFFTSVPNSFEYRQNAPFSILVLKGFLYDSKSFQIPSECTVLGPCFHFCSLRFQIISNTVRMYHLASLFSIFSLYFKIVSNAVRIHHLASLLLKSSLQFKIASITVRMQHLATLFLIFSLQFQIVLNSVRIHALSCSWLASEVPTWHPYSSHHRGSEMSNNKISGIWNNILWSPGAW